MYVSSNLRSLSNTVVQGHFDIGCLFDRKQNIQDKTFQSRACHTPYLSLVTTISSTIENIQGFL